jgi:hypothetical protein
VGQSDEPIRRAQSRANAAASNESFIREAVNAVACLNADGSFKEFLRYTSAETYRMKDQPADEELNQQR